MAACPKCGAPAPAGARFCASCGTELTAASAGEQRKVVTVLFADVTGSTSLGEQLDPERLRALLATYFAEMAQVIASWGGVVEKYIGDAIMAVFGTPAVREDDAERALRAALEMGDRLRLLNERFERDHGVALEIRIGVNTGDVVTPGGHAPDQLMVTGDAVNVAARLEQAAAPGTVLVGDRTYATCRGAFAFDDPAPLDLKGKSAPVVARRLIAALAEPQRGVTGLRAPMVGRERELATLIGLFDEAVETGRPRMAVVYGPAGIGKSRLVAEFLGALGNRQPTPAIHRGRCLAAGHGITYWAFAEILRTILGVGIADPVEEVRGRLAQRVGQLLAPLGLSPEELDRTIEALAVTAGIGVQGIGSDHSPGSGHPSVTAEDIGRAWPRLATALVSDTPAVWLVEDLHWAGEPVPDMLQRIATRTEGPLFILATARPEFAETHPEFAAWGGSTAAISLRPLTATQSEEMLSALLAVADLPTGLRAEILGKAEGNPFFVEEIVQRLIDAAVIAPESGHWRATGAPLPPIPDSIQALIAARIDGLAPLAHQVLQEAAVVGRTFWAPPVERAIGSDVTGPLLELEQKGLVLVRASTTLAGQTEYMHKHALVRDVAYASLPKARRARAHADVGAWIEAIAGDRLDELAELVADHYHAAVTGEDADLAWIDDPSGREAVRRRAFEALIRAGRVARRRFAIDRALELHEQALAIADSDGERLDAFDQLGRDHEAVFDGDRAMAAYQQAITIVRTRPEWNERRAAIIRRATGIVAMRGGSFHGQPDMPQVDELIAEALAIAQDTRERTTLLLASGVLRLEWELRGFTDPKPLAARLEAIEEARTLAARLSEPALQFSAASALSDLLVSAGSYRDALAVMTDALPLLEQIDRPAPIAPSAFDGSLAVLELGGDADLALQLAERSQVVAKDRSPHEQMHATAALMRAAYHLGDWDRVERHLAEHLVNFDLDPEIRCLHAQTAPNIGGLVLAHRGDAAAAVELVRRTQPLDRLQGRVLGAQARTLVAAGQAEQGLELARVALQQQRWRAFDGAEAALLALEALGRWAELGELARELDDLREAGPYLPALLDRALGQSLAAAGDAGAGRARLEAALAALSRIGARFEAARTRELLADCVAPTEARQLLQAASATYEALGASPHRARIEARIAAL